MIRGRKLYLNLYTFLVGPPGGGKTTAVIAARDLLTRVQSVKLAPSKVTPEKFINLLSKSNSVEVKNGQVSQHVSFAVFCNELGVFVRPGDRDFTFILTDMYDCPDVFSYETITRGQDKIENLFINLLGGITPVSLASVIGDESIGMGFTARIFFIYAADPVVTDPFDVPLGADAGSLVHDLELINMLAGHFSFSPDAMAAVREWYAAGLTPVPADPRFAEYNPRRLTHWIKLSALRSASRSQDAIIEAIDCAKAKADLLEAERFMPSAFASLGANPINTAVGNAGKWLMIQYAITKAGVPESALRAQLMKDIPLQYIDHAIEAMLNGGLAMHMGGAKPNRFLYPKNPVTVSPGN